MKRLNHYFQTSKPFRNRLCDCREIATQNWHVYAICCRPEGECDVVSGQNEKTIDGYVAVDFEVASSSSFRDTLKIMFHVSLKNWVRDAGSSQVAKRLISYYVGGFMKYKVFNRLWKTETEVEDLMQLGMTFPTEGDETENARLPNTVLQRGTLSYCLSGDLRERECW